MAKQFTLGKGERLKSRKLIEALFAQGKSFTLAPFRVLYGPAAILENLQAGFGVSGKNFKRAVDRNRIKRLTREAWRLQKLPLQQHLASRQMRLIVFLIYTSKSLPDYPLVTAKMQRIIQRLISLVDENNTQLT
jgi:ribonuclease P protein component